MEQVQNAMAPLLTGASCPGHVTLILCELQWLPGHVRVQFKTLELIYKSPCRQGLRHPKGCLLGALLCGPCMMKATLASLREEGFSPSWCLSCGTPTWQRLSWIGLCMPFGGVWTNLFQRALNRTQCWCSTVISHYLVFSIGNISGLHNNIMINLTGT